jgi:hypothetical protein
MSSATAKPQPQKKAEYDEAKLAQMTPPLTVTVEKIVAGRKQPIELPIKPGENIAGQGWSADDVRELPTFLGRKAVGAGIVAIKVTDVNNVGMQWEWFFSPQDYERLAAPSNDPTAAALAAMPPPQVMIQQPGAPAPQAFAQMQDPYSGWLGTVSRQPQQIPGGMQPAGTYRPIPQQQHQQGAPMYPQLAPVPSIAAAPDDRLREEREARIRLESEISRKDLENRYKEQIGSVNTEVRQLAAQLGQVVQLVQQRPGATEEAASVQSLKEQIARLEAANREDKITQLIAQQAAQTQALLAQMKADSDRAIAALTSQLAAKPTGPDPTLMMMMEMQKQQQASQLQYMQMLSSQNQSQLGPREWIDLTRSMNTGAEQQATAFSKAWELMMQGVETILHAQGPGVHPAIEMIGQGIQAAAGMVERQAEAKEKVGTAQAQAAMYQAQANAQLAAQLAQRGQLAGPAQPQAAPARDAQAEQDAADAAEQDAADADDASETEQQQQQQASTNVRPAGVSSGAARPAPIVDAEAQAARKKADREMFGAALQSIQKLRKKVRDGEFDQQTAAAAILQGVDQIMKLKVKVPIMDLWAAGQLADVLELMLPDATMKFREQVIEAIVQIVQQAQQAAQAQAAAQASGAPS